MGLEPLESRMLLTASIPSGYTLVDTYTIGTTSAVPVMSAPLTPGVDYYAVASGKVKVGGSSKHVADAEYHQHPSKGWQDLTTLTGHSTDMGLGDQDVYGQSPANEDDLIQVKINLSNPNHATVLSEQRRLYRPTSILRVFTEKTGNQASELFFNASGLSDVLDGVDDNGEITVWVAWKSTDHGTADLKLVDLNGNSVYDTLTFHTFRSHVIMTMGFTQDPAAGVLSFPGIEESAMTLYKEGYDVHLYEWHEQQDNVFFNRDNPLEELKTAVVDRHIEQFVIMGYSYGGGAIYDFALNLYQPENNWVVGAEFALSVYVDAVRDWTAKIPEERKPPGSVAHANYYQRIDTITPSIDQDIKGLATSQDIGVAEVLENDNMSQLLLNAGIVPGEGHTNMDSFEAVTSRYLGHIRGRLENH